MKTWKTSRMRDTLEARGMSPAGSKKQLVGRLDERIREGEGRRVEVHGRAFVCHTHEAGVRLYAVSSRRHWNLVVRKLGPTGVIVVLHSRALAPQLFIPHVESFADKFV